MKYAFASNLCHGTDEIKLILGIHAGKLLFKTFYVSFVKFNLLSFVRHAIMAAFCLWFLLSGTTGAIGLLALVYDMGDVQIQLEEIMDTWKTPFYSKARYYNTVLGVVMRVVFNCVIPTSFIIYIVINSSPIAANPSNLALLFLFLMYTFAVNTFLIITAISKMRNARQVRYLYKIARQDDKSELEFYYLSNILHRANPNSPFRCKTDNPGISTIYCNNIISSTTTTTSSPQRTDS